MSLDQQTNQKMNHQSDAGIDKNFKCSPKTTPKWTCLGLDMCGLNWQTYTHSNYPLSRFCSGVIIKHHFCEGHFHSSLIFCFSHTSVCSPLIALSLEKALLYSTLFIHKGQGHIGFYLGGHCILKTGNSATLNTCLL